MPEHDEYNTDEMDGTKSMEKRDFLSKEIRNVLSQVLDMSDNEFALLYIALSAEYEKRFGVTNWTSDVVSAIYEIR